METEGHRRVFVGRAAELDQLATALAEARAGRGSFVLLRGEAGVGKTRAADQLAQRAAAADAAVLLGRCDDSEGAPPFWPWLQVLRTFADGCTTEHLSAALGSGAAAIAEVVPEVGVRLGQIAAPAAIDPPSARWRLFDAVATLLRAASRQRPHLVVIDDLQWADVPSLLLLRFLGRQLADMHVLLLATHRDHEIDAHDPRAELIDQIAAAGPCRSLLLRGLSESEGRSLIEGLTGGRAAADVARWIVAETSGNPLFITEVVHELGERGGLAQLAGGRPGAPAAPRVEVPESVRPIIATRLRRLDPATVAVLETAAVVGREFDTALLTAVLGSEHGRDALAAVHRAAEAGVLQRTRTLGHFQFAHPLMRESLHQGIGGERRIALHERVGRTLVAIGEREGRLDLDGLAHHFYEAALGGTAEEAGHYGVRAGEQSMAVYAFEKAAGHFDRALQALDLCGAPAARRGAVLMALAHAEFLSGGGRRADEHSRAAMDVARQLGDGVLFGRAVLAYRGVWGVAGTADPEYLGLAEEALRLLPDGDDALRIQLMGRLATELYWTDQGERRERLAGDAIAMARRIGAPAAIVGALSAAHFACWRPDNTLERLALADEQIELARTIGDMGLTAGGRVWRVIDLVELGRMNEAVADIEAYAASAARLQSPYFDWQRGVLHSLRAQIEGRLGDAEQAATAAFAVGSGAVGANADTFYAIAMLQLRWLQGRLGELEAPVRAFVAQYPAIPAWRAALAFICAEQEHHEDAWRELETLAAGDFAGVPRDTNRLASLSLLAEVCAFLGDTPRALALRAHLEPFAGRVVVVGNGAACFGAVSYYLGRLCAVLGHRDDARRFFDDALATHRRMGARAHAAIVQYAYAEMLVESGDSPVASSEAAARLSEAAERARSIGMARIEHLAERLRGRLVADRVAAAPPSEGGRTPEAAAARYSLRREGDYWNVGREGGAFRLKHGKGLVYIAHMLDHPGQEILVTDLWSITEPGDGSTPALRGGAAAAGLSTTSDLGDAGPAIDASARAAYGRRLAELRDELRDAEEMNDLGRRERARDEVEALTHELARSVGLGGRERRVGSHRERARVNVTRTVRKALEAIARNDPVLGRYLDATIRTGTFCSYQPDPGRPVQWEVSC